MCTLGFAGREEGENRRGMGRKEGGGGGRFLGGFMDGCYS